MPRAYALAHLYNPNPHTDVIEYRRCVERYQVLGLRLNSYFGR